MKTIADLMRYEDGFADISGNWREFSGPAWVQDNALGLSAGVTQLVYLTREEMDSLEHRAECSFRIDRASADARIGLMVRAEWLDASPDYIHRTYLVTIDGTGAVAVYSILTTDPAPAPIATGTVDLDVSRAHKFVVKVTDADRSLSLSDAAPDLGAEIKVYMDDQIGPVLTCVDQNTLRPEGKYVGFDMLDSSGSEGVTLGEFYGYVSRSAVIRNPVNMPELKNFGDLIYETGYRLDRHGNSQFNTTVLGSYINEAYQEVWRFTHPWTWAFRITHFTTRTGVRCYELPAYVKSVTGLTDKDNPKVLCKGTWKDMRRADPGDQVNSQYPLSYQVLGMGDFGGPVISLFPVPGGEYFIEVPYYARPIPMVEMTDVPLIPVEYFEALVYGALKRGAQYSDAQTLYQISTAEFDKMLQQMRREDIARRDDDFQLRLKSDLELGRTERRSRNWQYAHPWARYR